MTLHDASIGHEATADFSHLLAEAARVLSDMAATNPADRAEEFATLQEIHAEGADFVSMPGIPSSLRSLFASVLALGAKIASTTSPLPETVVAQVHVVESLTRTIASGLDEDGDPSPYVQAINRSIAALTMATPHTRDLREATDAAKAALEKFVDSWSH